MTPSIHAVLFDLDGTLLDTAPDLVDALNQLRKKHGLAHLPFEKMRSIVGLGSKTLIKQAFEINEDHPHFDLLCKQFMTLYETRIAHRTQFFPKILDVLEAFDQRKIPWGIVTNKLHRLTLRLLKALAFDHRPYCIISGDSLTRTKPDPAPILHACELLKQPPSQCVYVGDAETDVAAAKAAGSLSLVVLYGYINTDPFAWQADGYLNTPEEIMDWILKYP